ncbi:membrane-anchored ubiquitin-fold protein 2 isoform X1 [Raphanus sativus]|uniref:Membrane-anchored ubiquitin-fold protein n=1 Tax=Raphanus sativus TaxID=3726 RepID=A0A6J0MSN0_RAPSA|nr:membrane-anchored ubiquitin-fold protein 2 isoform X1 [Raphanus sativus]
MAEVKKDHLEIKFRLNDGSDIGPKSFPDATTVAALKETVVAQWPREKENGPKTVKDVKLISAGRILENNKTVGDCRSPVSNLSDAVTTMHVLIQPQLTEKAEKKKKKKKPKGDLNQNKCVCLCFGRRL